MANLVDGLRRFPPGVAEKLGAYVYSLSDPESGRVFYIGKGRGNRVFAHAAAALSRKDLPPSPKLDRIREIQSRGDHVRVEIVRHGLDDATAHEIEAVLIELHEHRHPELLDNLVAGHGRERGRMSVSDIVALYSAPRAPKIAAPVILLRISRLWYPAMSADALYEATRGWWAIGERRNKADHACAVSRGVVREVYRIHRWRLRRKGDPGYSSADVRPRWGFEGAVSTELRELRNTDVTRYFSQGNSNPVRYVNC